MIRFFTLILLIVAALSGCVTINEDPDILLQEPYAKVKYVAEPGNHYKSTEAIKVQTRGMQANILNTIPLLYKKALKFLKNDNVEIGNIGISSYTKLENFQVPYQDCVSVPQTMSVPSTSCFNGSCQTTYLTQTQYIQQCTTRYRTEMRNVLYQVAVADVLTKK